MRGIFGILSLLIVVAVIGILAKKQLSSVADIPLPAVNTPAVQGSGNADGVPPSAAPSGNAQQQSQQIQQQIKTATEAALQQARPIPDEK